jgi:hypothetical protein
MNAKSLAFFMAATAFTTASFAAEIWVNDANGHLARVDIATGAVTLVGNNIGAPPDIAFDLNGNLFGFEGWRLDRIDPNTGATSFIPTTPQGGPPISRFGYGPVALGAGPDGTLYTASDTLYKVDTSSGAVTAIGTLGGDFNAGFSGDITFVNGSMYLSDLKNRLLRVNPATGAATLIGTMQTNPISSVPYLNTIAGLASPDGQTLYGVEGNSIYRIDTTNANTTLVSNWTVDPNSLQFALGATGPLVSTPSPGPGSSTAPEPTPASLLLVGGALTVVFFARRSIRDKLRA